MYQRTRDNVKGDAFDKALVVAQAIRGEQIQGEAVGPAMLTVPSTTTRSTRRASPVELESSWTPPVCACLPTLLAPLSRRHLRENETTGGMNQAAYLPCASGKVSKQGSSSCSACAAGKWASSAMACTVIRHTPPYSTCCVRADLEEN